MTDPALIIEAADADSVRADLVAMIEGLRPSWHADAACRGESMRWFFPERGDPLDAAYQVCGRCPVRVPCLAEAIADPALDFGVRGGLSAQARKARRRLQAKRGTA